MDMNRVFGLNMSLGHANRTKGNIDAAAVDEAIDAFSKAIEISPDNPDGYEHRGHAFWQRYNYSQNPDDIDLAIQDFRHALDLLTSGF